MQQYKLITFIGIVVFLISPQNKAQTSDSTQVLTLEKVWSISELHNRQLKLSDLHRKESELSIIEAKDKLLPDLSVAGDFKFNSKFLIYNNGLLASPQDVPVSNYGYGVGYNFNLNLYSGGKEKRNIKMKEEEEIIQQYEFDLQKNNTKYNAAVAYCDLYKFLQFREFISTEISSEKKQLQMIENLNKNGVVMKSDVLRTSVKLSQLELSLSDIEKKIEVTRQKLNILMGRDGNEYFEISYQNSFEPNTIREPDYNAYLDQALDQSPQYKIAYSYIKLSEMNIQQVQSAVLPKVSLYSNYNYTFPQVSFYPYSNDLWGFGQTGIRVQFSIDNLYKNRHSVAHARNLSDQQKEKAGIKKDEIRMLVKDAYLQQQQAVESVEMAEKNIAKTTETVRVIRNSYLNQESLLTDLLDAENVLLEAKLNLTTAQVTLKLSHIRLLAIIGIL
ncbi:TolC family protein [Chryseobacterium lactis]|uniref:TolC family protein n=2 Tax=Chryseobacterium lactis TaxID=1241981 RepID=A0A3G6RMZ7_CHRLC|nr:TolC family protein [Chryseobacterium lactis]AZB04549.1 TolC family protein [Chryseobacterium lactis]PNW12717.1 TolC family protein [Chryseobacterium lactis]